MAVAGVVVYWTISGAGKSPVARYGMAALTLLITAMTWTQLSEPPKPRALKISWIVVPVAFSMIAYVLDRKRSREAAVGAGPAVSRP